MLGNERVDAAAPTVTELIRAALEQAPWGLAVFEESLRGLRLLYANAAAQPVIDLALVHLEDMRTAGDRGPSSEGQRAARAMDLRIVRLGQGRVAVFMDMSAERAGMEEQLRRITRFWAAVLEHIPGLLLIKDAAEGRIVAMSRAWESEHGLALETALGHTDAELFPPEIAAAYRDADREAVAQGGVVLIPEERLATPRGERWLRTRKVGIRVGEGEGRPGYVLLIAEDITEQRAREAEVQRAHVELRRQVEEARAEVDEKARIAEELARRLASLEQQLGSAGG